MFNSGVLNKLKFFISLFLGIYLFILFFFVLDFYLKISLFFVYIIYLISVYPLLNVNFSLRRLKLLDLFKLASFFSICVPFIFSVNSINKSGFLSVFGTFNISTQVILEALFLVLFAIISLNISNLLVISFFKVRVYRDYLYLVKNYIYLIAFSFFVFLINFYLVVVGVTGFGGDGVSSSNSFLIFFLFNFQYIILVVLGYLFFFKVPYWGIKYFYFLFIFLSLFSSILSGMKENFLIVFFLILIPYLFSDYKINRILKFSLLISFFFLTSFLYPLINQYRFLSDSGLSKIDNLGSAIEFVFFNPSDLNSEEDLSLFERYSSLGPLTYGVSVKDDWNLYGNLDRYIFLPVSWFLPRFLTPGKPTNDMSSKLYMQMRNTDKSDVSITPTTFGWSIFEGSYIAYFFSFLIFGIVISIMDRLFPTSNLFGIIVFTIIGFSLLKVEADIYFRIVAIFQFLFMLFIFRILFLAKY